MLKILRESIPFKVFNGNVSTFLWLKGDFPGTTQEEDYNLDLKCNEPKTGKFEWNFWRSFLDLFFKKNSKIIFSQREAFNECVSCLKGSSVNTVSLRYKIQTLNI